MKNPSNNATPIDVVINLKVIKCRYPDCQYPTQPAFGAPATARPSNALYWSNDSHWSFATQGYGGYGMFDQFYIAFNILSIFYRRRKTWK